MQDTGTPVDTAATSVGDTTAPVDTWPPLDTVADTAPDTSVPAPDVTAVYENCTPPGGSVNIYDLQDPQCPDHPNPEPQGAPGIYVELDGVVVTGTFGDTMFVQEPAGGPYSGITVFNREIPTDDLEPGDVIDVVGNYFEFFENSQIYLDSYTVVGSQAEPEPFVPAHPSHISPTGALAEMFEGVLVRVEDTATIHTQPDCPLEFGEFLVLGGVRIDNMGYEWDARLGDRFASITGPMIYAFGNHKIEPRTEADVVVTTAGNAQAISKCLAVECSVRIDDPGTKTVVISEHMPDPWGSDDGQEWIELHNPGDSPVNIQGWQLRTCAGQTLTLSGPNLTIGAGKYLVVGMNANYATNGGVPVDLAYGNLFYLPNTLGSILLFDGGEVGSALIDQIRYSRFDPWFSMKSGHSLERVNLTGDGTDPDNWETGSSSYGSGSNYGTPRERNDAR